MFSIDQNAKRTRSHRLSKHQINTQRSTLEKSDKDKKLRKKFNKQQNQVYAHTLELGNPTDNTDQTTHASRVLLSMTTLPVTRQTFLLVVFD